MTLGVQLGWKDRNMKRQNSADWETGTRVMTPVLLWGSSTGLLEWWRQWWSSLFFSRQPKSIQQQRVNHSRSLSFITPERSGLICKWKHFQFGYWILFFLMHVWSIHPLWCVEKWRCFETDSIDFRLLSFQRSSAVRSAAWYDFNQQIE